MRFYPIIHLLPGMSEIIFVVTKQQINVVAAIQGMAATVGNARLCLNTVTHRPSQNMCIRYMPELSFDISVMSRGDFGWFIQLNIRKVPVVRSTQLMVQKAHPISITGVDRFSPGIAWI